MAKDISRLNGIAALLALSNMGQRLGKPEDYMWMKQGNGTLELDTAIEGVCGPYMESDEHFDGFMSEGYSFIKSLKKFKDAVFADPAAWPYWNDIGKLYDAIPVRQTA